MTEVFTTIGTFFSNLMSLIKTLRFGFNSLTSGVWRLISQVFDGTLFSYVYDGFDYISNYIGTTATVFISSLLAIIIFRIGLAFVFKIFRLNIDYRTLQDKNDRVEKRAKAQHRK